jgi:calcium and integrin-binding protein 1
VFTKYEVIRCLQKFEKLTKDKNKNKKRSLQQQHRHQHKDMTYILKRSLTKLQFADMPELRFNPFRKRIAEVFARDDHKIGFDEYLEFLSVFSEEATADIKRLYAFRIYDHDEDGHLGKADLVKTIKCLVGNHLTDHEIVIVAKKVFEESDLDGDEMLSYVEFEHIVSKKPDFIYLFRIQLDI